MEHVHLPIELSLTGYIIIKGKCLNDILILILIGIILLMFMGVPVGFSLDWVVLCFVGYMV